MIIADPTEATLRDHLPKLVKERTRSRGRALRAELASGA
jgi:hypothetical protein